MTPLFSWDTPIGVNSYIIEFTTEDDLDFQNIIFSSTVNSPFFLSSNIGFLPFNNGSTYLWRVKPVNNNGEEGFPSEVFSFSTILDNSNLEQNQTDVIGVFFNNQNIGWEFYNEQVTLIPASGDDGSLPNYPQEGDSVTF